MADYNTRLTNVENTLSALIKSLNLKQMYSEADTNGVKQNINNVDTNAKEGINTNSANIDYVAMMCDVEMPTEE